MLSETTIVGQHAIGQAGFFALAHGSLEASAVRVGLLIVVVHHADIHALL